MQAAGSRAKPRKQASQGVSLPAINRMAHSTPLVAMLEEDVPVEKRKKRPGSKQSAGVWKGGLWRWAIKGSFLLFLHACMGLFPNRGGGARFGFGPINPFFGASPYVQQPFRAWL